MLKRNLQKKLYKSSKVLFTIGRTMYSFIRGVLTGSASPFSYWVEPNKKILFLSVPKAANTSVKGAMYQWEGREHSGGYSSGKRDEARRLFVRRRKQACYIEKKYPGYFRFCFVRNPFDRIVSCYENKYHTGMGAPQLTVEGTLFNYLSGDKGFPEFARRVSRIPLWLADKHFVPQSTWLFDKKGECRVDYIGKFENLERDWTFVMEKHELLPIPHYNKSKRGNWMDYYDRKTAEILYQYYQEDIQKFGYETAYKELLDYIEQKGNSIMQ